MAAYLFAHPDVNTFFTGLQGLPKTGARPDQTYLDANPSIRTDLETSASRRPTSATGATVRQRRARPWPPASKRAP